MSCNSSFEFFSNAQVSVYFPLPIQWSDGIAIETKSSAPEGLLRWTTHYGQTARMSLVVVARGCKEKYDIFLRSSRAWARSSVSTRLRASKYRAWVTTKRAAARGVKRKESKVVQKYRDRPECRPLRLVHEELARVTSKRPRIFCVHLRLSRFPRYSRRESPRVSFLSRVSQGKHAARTLFERFVSSVINMWKYVGNF